MFVIPMVGKSSRFFEAGYSEPKYKLKFGTGTVFSHSVESFSRYFKTDPFLFIVRHDYDAYEFVSSEATRMGIERFEVVVISHETRGQADTVYLGLDKVLPEEPVYIFNIDTFRPGFTKPEWVSSCDAFLEVFKGEGEHWSFIEPGENYTVVKTTEKVRISNLCSNGLYFFKNKQVFFDAFEQAVNDADTVNGEYYIAPLYNHVISDGGLVHYRIVDSSEMVFCGTPTEYVDSLKHIYG